MKLNNNYVVYMHIFPNNKKYIGITCQEPNNRWRNGKKYINNSYMNNAINKYGWDNIEHKIMYSKLSKEQAEFYEITLIKHYKSNQREYGYNIDKGGNHHGKRSQETIEKMKNSLKGRISPCGMLGKKHSIETKKRMSISRTGIKQNKETILKRANKLKKKVSQYSIEGEFIKNWSSIKDASISLNIKDSSISQVCKNKRKQCGGYKWSYYYEI